MPIAPGELPPEASKLPTLDAAEDKCKQQQTPNASSHQDTVEHPQVGGAQRLMSGLFWDLIGLWQELAFSGHPMPGDSILSPCTDASIGLTAAEVSPKEPHVFEHAQSKIASDNLYPFSPEELVSLAHHQALPTSDAGPVAPPRYPGVTTPGMLATPGYPNASAWNHLTAAKTSMAKATIQALTQAPAQQQQISHTDTAIKLDVQKPGKDSNQVASNTKFHVMPPNQARDNSPAGETFQAGYDSASSKSPNPEMPTMPGHSISHMIAHAHEDRHTDLLAGPGTDSATVSTPGMLTTPGQHNVSPTTAFTGHSNHQPFQQVHATGHKTNQAAAQSTLPFAVPIPGMLTTPGKHNVSSFPDIPAHMTRQNVGVPHPPKTTLPDGDRAGLSTSQSEVLTPGMLTTPGQHNVSPATRSANCQASQSGNIAFVNVNGGVAGFEARKRPICHSAPEQVEAKRRCPSVPSPEEAMTHLQERPCTWRRMHLVKMSRLQNMNHQMWGQIPPLKYGSCMKMTWNLRKSKWQLVPQQVRSPKQKPFWGQ